jgi:putative transposase
MSNDVVCKYCQSSNVRKYGHYGDTQYYYCNVCKRKFTPNASLFGMKTPANQVSSALDMYYKGLSLNEIREHLQSQPEYDNTPSSSTVFQWVEKYTDDAVKECDKYQPKVGDKWVADETYVRIDKHSKAVQVDNPYSKSKKAKWVIFWDIIDADTRFLLASLITTTRDKNDAQILMEKAAKRAGKIPKVVVTDKLASYLEGIELAFGVDAKHVQSKPFDIGSDNNLIERLHGTIKERTKVMRGLRTAETAKRFLDGWAVYYNYMKPHESLDSKTPAEAAKCDYTFRDWADLSRLVDLHVRVLVTPAKVEVIPEIPIAKYRVPTRRFRKKKKRTPIGSRGQRGETSVGQIRL